MSDNMTQGAIWIVGTGNMAKEYCKVLHALDLSFRVIGNTEASVEAFYDATGIKAYQGGIDAFLSQTQDMPWFVINAVNTPNSCHTLLSLMDYGVKLILSEKPAGLTCEEVDRIGLAAASNHVRIVVAYNRRFYSSVLAAQKIIDEDGGVTSFQFEFTELYRVISTKEGDVSRWFYGNSSHVLDLAFYLGGSPQVMSCYNRNHEGKYTSSTRFAGAGISQSGALFAYHSNWLAPGRWVVEVETSRHRLIFCPMEKLKLQQLGSFDTTEAAIDDSLDKEFKPGIFQQVKAFVEDPYDARFLSIEDQSINMHHYRRIHDGVDLCE